MWRTISKGEVDHVGGLAKVTIRHAVAEGQWFFTPEEMVAYLSNKFKESSAPVYFFKEIYEDFLKVACDEASLLSLKTISGCDNFQVIFYPQCKMFKAAARLCFCDICRIEYGPCSLFHEYEPVVHQLKKISLRSS